MNVDTDMQYAFTRPVAAHMFEHYEGVMRVDGGLGDKKAFDPRAWGRLGEASMAARVGQACSELGSAGRSLQGNRRRDPARWASISAGRRSRSSSSTTSRR